MVLFVFFCVFMLIALITFGVSFAVERGDDRMFTRVTAGIVAFISILFLFFASTTMVDTKKVAVLTVAGKPSGHLSNGWHWKAPWAKPHELNGAVQTNTYASDNGGDHKQGGATDTCIHVRVERQAIACVNASVRWQIRESGVDYLFRNYKDNNAIQDNVVLRDLQQAMNEAFVSYDPLGIDNAGLSTNSPLSIYSDKVQKQMQAEIGQYIDVQSIIIPILNYDPSTQDKVHQLLQQIANTRVAQQQEQTSKAQAKANKALAESVSNDPNVLTDKCLNILKEAVDKGQSLPAGFSCFGPSSTGIAVGVK